MRGPSPEGGGLQLALPRFSGKDHKNSRQPPCPPFATASGSIVPSNQFFTDYSNSSCLKDYRHGPFRCMSVPPLVALYDSIEACGTVGMW